MLNVSIQYGEEDLSAAKSLVEGSEGPDGDVNRACLLYKVNYRWNKYGDDDDDEYGDAKSLVKVMLKAL